MSSLTQFDAGRHGLASSPQLFIPPASEVFDDAAAFSVGERAGLFFETPDLVHQHVMGIAIEAEAQAQAICMQTKDFLRAYEAFAAKRKPVFEGD